MEIVRSLPEEKWRQFVENHPQSSIFHTPEMYQVFSHTKGYWPQLWAVLQNEQILCMLLPVQISLHDGIFRSFTTRAVAHGSVLVAPGSEGREAVERLLRDYARRVEGSPLFTELRNIVDLSDIQPILDQCNFVFEGHLNYLIDLDQPEEAIWSKLSKKTRQHVQKARSSSLVLEDMCFPQEIDIVYQLLEQVYRRVHVPLANISLLRSAFEILHSRGMMKAFLVRSGERYIGCNVFLLYKDRIFDWFRASDRTFSALQAESFMLWQILQWGRESQFRVFDFGGAGKPEEDYGPRIFKSRWGGRLVNYGRNICVHAPRRLKISNIAYQLMRKIPDIF